jgi:hypothetical protein
MILSQTFYLQAEKKILLQSCMTLNPIWQNKNFWVKLIEFSINDEINNSINYTLFLSEDGNSREKRVDSAVLSNLITFLFNMKLFGYPDDKSKIVIDEFVKKYNIDGNLVYATSVSISDIQDDIIIESVDNIINNEIKEDNKINLNIKTDENNINIEVNNNDNNKNIKEKKDSNNENKNININNNNHILSNIGCKSLLFNSNMIYKSPLLKNNYSAKNNNGTKIKFNEPIKNVKKFPINQINLTSYKIPKSLEMNRVSINRNKNFEPFARDINDINFVFINNNIKISPKQNKKIQLNHCKTLKEIKNRFINNNFQTYNNY